MHKIFVHYVDKKLRISLRWKFGAKLRESQKTKWNSGKLVFSCFHSNGFFDSPIKESKHCSNGKNKNTIKFRVPQHVL